MAHEFYQIMVGAPSISLYSWKQLARWSIDYSCLSVREKAEGHKILNSEWKKFCQEVVEKYRPIMAGAKCEGDEVDDKKAEKLYAKRKVKKVKIEKGEEAKEGEKGHKVETVDKVEKA